MGKTKNDNFANLAAAAAKATAEFRQGLAAIREKIYAAKKERSRIAHLPVDLETAENRIADWLAGELAFSNRRGSISEYFLFPDDRFERRKPDLIGNFEDKVRYYLAKTVAEQVKCDCADALRGTECITEDVRTKRLAEIDAEISDLERAEERLIRAAEAAGLVAPRRADASPEALLSEDDDTVLSEVDRAELERAEERVRRIAGGGSHEATDFDGGPILEMA
ncbi:hypothetical protein [Mesorhizobium sp. KR1-2]|uniref:hypothetical protein n=1 Tax=Mesorhizobium sp. KR1-2 TaxID=3156609 RepID=UPI0032B31858